MKTYHNDANTSGITKIGLKKIWTFFDKEDRLAKLQKSDFQSHFLRQKLSKSLPKKKFVEEYQFRATTFAKIIF